MSVKTGADKYNLMFIIDDKYNDILPIVINNISKVSSDIVHDLIFNISYFGDKNSSEDLLQTLSKLNLNIKLKVIPDEFTDLSELLEYHYSKTTHHEQIPTASVYYRFFLASTWPELNGKLLYLDTDILVRESLSKLFALIPTETKYPLFAPAFPRGKSNTWSVYGFRRKKHKRCVSRILSKSEKLKKECEELALDLNNCPKRNTFNGGVWFYDLDVIRSGIYEDKMKICMEIQSVEKIFLHNDQGIMNFVFLDFYHLPPEWNSLNFGFNKAKTTFSFNLSKIVHFNGPTKPWSKPIPKWFNKFAMDEWNTNKL
jgi:lipopolysaccharide biosynthesis glycosyltransferase